MEFDFPEVKRKYVFDGEETDYIVSNYGYIESIKISNKNKKDSNYILKPHVMESGYNIVCLYINRKAYWKYVHRIVAETFIKVPEKYIKQGYTIKTLEVNHIDGSFTGKSKNDVSNLEWATSSDNKYHAYRHRLKLDGEDHPESIYTAEQIHKVCKLLEDDQCGNRIIWRKTGVSVTTIQAILSGTQWKSISQYYDFSNHHKRHCLYMPYEIKRATELLKTSDLSCKDIDDLVGMTRNAVWSLNKRLSIR